MKDKILYRLKLERNNYRFASIIAGTDKPWEKTHLHAIMEGIDKCIEIIENEDFEESDND